MMASTQSSQEFFRLVLTTVVGQAFDAAGYSLEDRPTQWAGGQFRFHKRFEDGMHSFVIYQNLAYAEPNPSRFRVTLVRSDLLDPTPVSRHPRFDRRTLSVLVVQDFGVDILPAADYWWTYRDVTELGKALAESGHLVAGFGIPWLAGELTP
jgi:hypothetical protein